MSRTDTHRPGWVRERDPHLRREYRVYHQHLVREHWDPEQKRWLVQRVAPCDLPPREGKPANTWTRCGWDYIGGRGQCGCHGCTGRYGRKRTRRRERHDWQTQQRALVAAARADCRNLDTPSINRKALW